MQQFAFPYELSLKPQLPSATQDLLDAAESAAEKAYAPYSRFKVGAALLLTDGRVLTAANQENAAFPAGICAERAVLSMHHMEGPEKVYAIAIAYMAANASQQTPLAPCGICRQSILELQLHQGRPITIYMSAPDGEVIMVEDASYLLPFHFTGKYL